MILSDLENVHGRVHGGHVGTLGDTEKFGGAPDGFWGLLEWVRFRGGQLG